MLEPITNLAEARMEFDRCWPWLEASLNEFGPTHNKLQVWWRIENQKAYLWTSPHAAIVGEFYFYPSGLRAFNYWLQGGKLSACKAMHEGIEAWVDERAPVDMYMGFGRRGWIREMHGDWKEGYTQRVKRVAR